MKISLNKKDLAVLIDLEKRLVDNYNNGTPFNLNRKITRVHQHVLVFYKGDPKEIKNNFKELDLDY